MADKNDWFIQDAKGSAAQKIKIRRETKRSLAWIFIPAGLVNALLSAAGSDTWRWVKEGTHWIWAKIGFGN